MEAWVREYLALTTYEISCPVLRDPALAPAGKTGVIVSTLMDYRLVKAIAEAGWYPAFKTLCEEQMMAVLENSIFPGLTRQVEQRFSSTPLTIERLTGNLGGAITGWTKNQAAGVAKTPLLMLVLVFFWITAVASAPFYLVLNLIWQQWLGAGLMAACYGIWVLELTRIARHIGSFSVISIVFYPPLLLFYLLIFLRSLAKKILGHPVIWKDRKIRLDK